MSEFAFLRAAPPTAFLFSPQGSQQVGMIKELADAYPVASQTLAEADDALGFALSKLCFEGPEETLTDTINAQPALLTAGIASLRAIKSELGDDVTLALSASTLATPENAHFVAGHSMGEYTALVAAGSLRFVDGLHLVRERGRLMKEAGTIAPGMMAAIIGMAQEEIAEVCAAATTNGSIAQIANDNCPGQVVISGNKSGMETAMQALKEAGARRVIPLAVSIAAHSPLMEPAAAGLRAAIDATPIADPQIPVLGNTSAHPLTTAAEIQAELTTQLTGNVRWRESMQHALDAGITTFAEFGPGDSLTGMVKRIQRKTKRMNINDPAGVAAFVEYFTEKL